MATPFALGRKLMPPKVKLQSTMTKRPPRSRGRRPTLSTMTKDRRTKKSRTLWMMTPAWNGLAYPT